MTTRFWLRFVTSTYAMFLPLVALAQLTPVNPPAGTAQSDLGTALFSLVNIFLILVGVVATIILIYGGVQYIISRGDDGAVEKAKNTILYSVIGIIVIGLAAAIVNFVIRAIIAA